MYRVKNRKKSYTKLEKSFIKVYREESLRKNENRCEYCRDLLTYRNVTADHAHPRSKGGLDQKENIVASCKPCNTAKGSMSKKQFMKLISSFPTGYGFQVIMAWSRRRLNLQTERSIKRITNHFGINT